MSQQESDPDVLRMKYTFRIALIGIAGVLIALLMMLLGVAFVGIDKSSMAAVLGIIYGAIGTLAGLVIGHTMGSAGREKAQQQAAEAQRTLMEYMTSKIPSQTMDDQEGVPTSSLRSRDAALVDGTKESA
jgi:hypothetical protein